MKEGLRINSQIRYRKETWEKARRMDQRLRRMCEFSKRKQKKLLFTSSNGPKLPILSQWLSRVLWSQDVNLKENDEGVVFPAPKTKERGNFNGLKDLISIHKFGPALDNPSSESYMKAILEWMLLSQFSAQILLVSDKTLWSSVWVKRLTALARNAPGRSNPKYRNRGWLKDSRTT